MHVRILFLLILKPNRSKNKKLLPNGLLFVWKNFREEINVCLSDIYPTVFDMSITH